jgi:nucleoside-diphosphate-sugar epimerase
LKVFITGASGYIGRAAAAVLREAGHQVSGLARSEQTAGRLRDAGVEPVAGGLEDLESLRRGAGGADCVIHAALEWGSRAGQLDGGAVDAMLDELAGSGRAFVYTSGVWVYGDTKGRMLGEVARLNPPPLVAWRPAVEERVLEAASRDIMTTVLRPGMVFGRGGGFLKGLFDSAGQHREVRVVGDGDNHWSTIHLDDLAELYRLAVAEPQRGELFLATGGMPQQVKKIALAVARQCGLEGKVASIPVEQARETLGAMAGCLVMDSKLGSTKAARFFGWCVNKPSVFTEIEHWGG